MKEYIVGFTMELTIPVKAKNEDDAEDLVRNIMSQDDFHDNIKERLETEMYDIDDHSWFVEVQE